MTAPLRRPRFIIPEVVQTSATDCGPAAMKSVLAGMGRSIAYTSLREACQTDVSGSSINTLEELSKQLGLDAEQIMLPIEHVFLPEARALPAIIVTLTAGGRPHFVVLWNRVGPFVQVMNPARGRHWTTVSALSAQLYQHTTAVPAALWREWAGSEEATATFERRLRNLGCRNARELVADAREDATHHSLASLDAAARAIEAAVHAGAVRRGGMAARLVQSMLQRARTGELPIPESYASIRPNPAAEGDDDALLFTGAVLLRFRPPAELQPSAADAEPSAESNQDVAADISHALLTPEVDLKRTLFGLFAKDPRPILSRTIWKVGP